MELDVAGVDWIAAAVFWAGLCVLIGLGLVAMIALKIWRELEPMLSMAIVMNRLALKADLEEAHIDVPNWLEDEPEEEDARVFHLIKPEKE